MNGMPAEWQIYGLLMSGRSVKSHCAGPSMEPVYFDRDPITIHPFSPAHPDPVVGDVVHFYTYGGFNRHQVADVFHGNNGETWYRLTMGMGDHDQFVTRDQCFGYVVPDEMAAMGLTPADTYDSIEEQREAHLEARRANVKFAEDARWQGAVARNGR